MIRKTCLALALPLYLGISPYPLLATEPKFEREVIDDKIAIGYGLAIGDVDGDRSPTSSSPTNPRSPGTAMATGSASTLPKTSIRQSAPATSTMSALPHATSTAMGRSRSRSADSGTLGRRATRTSPAPCTTWCAPPTRPRRGSRSGCTTSRPCTGCTGCAPGTSRTSWSCCPSTGAATRMVRGRRPGPRLLGP